jgi:7-carboxy-7-deazaguanine synthase
MKECIRISEIFGPTIQGEGPLIGRPSVFVRTAGCDYRCRWCDTLYAVLPEYHAEWTFMSPAEIIQRVNTLAAGNPALISLSGGNPAMQPLKQLIALGRRNGHTFALETQGSLPQPWFADLDWLILSPKPPSSGMADSPEALEACIHAAKGKRCVLKVVIFDDLDYGYARNVATRYPKLPVYLQVGNPAPSSGVSLIDESSRFESLMHRFRWLVARVLADNWFTATVLPQLHVLAWGNKRGI